MKLRTKLPLTITAIMLLVAAAGLFAIWTLNQTVGVYARVIAFDNANERMAGEIAVDFKTQVQEWKNTLLRGKDPKAFEQHWTSFEKHEQTVSARTKELVEALPDGEARSQAEAFAQAHARMGDDYRKGLAAFQAAGFDSSIGDIAVKGMDRAPSEMLVTLRGKISENSTAAVDAATQSGRRAILIGLSLMAVAVSYTHLTLPTIYSV